MVIQRLKNMSLPILYSFRRCPYAMRARLALKYAGVSVVLREVALRNKPAGMLAVSPKGTVPVLVLPDGEVIAESLDIMRWALAQADPQGWLSQGEVTLGDALIAINDGPFKRLLDCYKYAERHPEKSSQAWRDEAIALNIAPLDARLRHTRYSLGDEAALADVAIMPFVRQFAEVDAAWFTGSPFSALRDWLQAWVTGELFASVMEKLPPWRAGDAETIF